MSSARTIEFAIRITYPPNVTREDLDAMLDELLETATARHGLGVDDDWKLVVGDDC